jgi:hypothetical protein
MVMDRPAAVDHYRTKLVRDIEGLLAGDAEEPAARD